MVFVFGFAKFTNLFRLWPIITREATKKVITRNANTLLYLKPMKPFAGYMNWPNIVLLCLWHCGCQRIVSRKKNVPKASPAEYDRPANNKTANNKKRVAEPKTGQRLVSEARKWLELATVMVVGNLEWHRPLGI